MTVYSNINQGPHTHTLELIDIKPIQILELLESFKLNMPDYINNTISQIHNKYCMLSINNTPGESTHTNINDNSTSSNIKKYWLYTTYMNCAILSNTTLLFRCFFTKNIVKSIYSNYLEWVNNIFYYYYYPQGDETFILIMGGSYNLPMGVYYPYKKSYFNLTYPSFGTIYTDCLNLINQITLEQIETNINLVNNKDEAPLSVFFFAWCSNTGHHIWNEVSGIYPLIETNLLKYNVDIVVIGDWDIFNIGSLILEHNPKCKIVKYKDFVNDPYYICTNIKYGIIGEGYILNETKQIIINHNNSLNYTNKFVLSIILKLDQSARSIQNIIGIYTNLINRLTSSNIIKPECLYVLFDGFYKHDTEQGMSYYLSRKDIYEESVKDIINNIDSRIEYKSLIGMSPHNVVQHYNSIKYFIGIIGANIYCIRHVYNKNGCVIYTKHYYDYSPDQDKVYVQDYNHDLEEIVITPNSMDQNILDEEQLYNLVVSGIQKLI